MSDNEDKTLKQLLTEPYRVQKKKGYYSYETFRGKLLNLFSTIDDKTGADTLSRAAINVIHSIYRCSNSLISNGESHSLEFSLTTACHCALMYLIEDHKKIYFLDENLCETLSETTPPTSLSISRIFCRDFLLLLPKRYGLGVCGYLVTSLGQEGFSLSFFPPESDIIKSIHFLYNQELDTNVFELDKEFSSQQKKRAKLVINFLLWQQSMHDKGQDVIEVDAPTRKMGFGKNTKQIIVPRVIGEGYKPKIIRNYEPTGTHASPRTHWRSGHWRQQPTGKRDNPEHKTIWIEPILVNP